MINMLSETLVVDVRFGVEYQGKYLFKEISWAKRSRIIQKYTKYNKLSGDVESSDFIGIQAETIMASLHGQPEGHPVTLERLLSDDVEKGVPIGLGEKLSEVANRVCGLTKDETLFLSDASSDKSLTLQSPTLDSAKSSVGPQQSLPSNLPESSAST